VSEPRKTAYTVYVHTYEDAAVYTTRQAGPIAVVHIDEAAILIRDVRTAEKLYNSVAEALDIMRGSWFPMPRPNGFTPTEEQSTAIKAALSTRGDAECLAIARAYPLEADEWYDERSAHNG